MVNGDGPPEPIRLQNELSISDRTAILRAGRQAPEHGIVYTPPHVAEFLFELLSPLRPKIVLDVASGNGDLSRPWQAVAKIIEYELGFGRDLFKCPDSIDTDLVLCNPPFGQEKEFLRRILKVVPETAPIVLFATHRVRLGSYVTSNDWKWCRDDWPPITSIVSLPRGVFKGVNETTEIILFRAPHLLPHYFLPADRSEC
jgi:type I restriction enzyme M protein